MRTAPGAFAPPAMRDGGGTSLTDAGTAAGSSGMSRCVAARTSGASPTDGNAGGSTASVCSPAMAGSARAAARPTRGSSPSTTSTGTVAFTGKPSAGGQAASGLTSSSEASRPSTKCSATTAIPVAQSMVASAPTSTRLALPLGWRASIVRSSAGFASDSGRSAPEDFERHTALGDARWVRAIYDAVMAERRQP